MAKKRFAITPKLKEEKKLKELPVQDISVEDIEKIAVGKQQAVEEQKVKKEKVVTPPETKKPITNAKKTAKKPQGRPRREEAVKRLSSDLPAELYDKVKEEVRNNGYTLNGFLAKVLREYFEKK